VDLHDQPQPPIWTVIRTNTEHLSPSQDGESKKPLFFVSTDNDHIDIAKKPSGSIGARIADMPNVSAQAAARSAASCTSRRSAAATIGGNRFAG
jgi:hypothetical protein